MDPSGINNTEKSELLLNHVNCESTDDESETEHMLPLNMLQIENEYETPIDSKFYRNNKNFSNFENSDKTQNITDYTEQELEGSLSTNNIHQNTASKAQLP